MPEKTELLGEDVVTRKQKGDDGENRAAEYLERHGFQIVARNWRVRSGEIDIIAQKENVLVFVEVKALPGGNADTLLKELDMRKQKRIVKTSKCFLLNNRKYSKNYIRYDVIVVDMPNFPSVYHIENAFSELL